MAEQPYGTWGDWLLCLSVIIFCEFPSMSQRNPEGHSPKYWRKHPLRPRPASPEDIRPLEPSIPKPATLGVVWRGLWSWWAVGIASAFFLAAGVTAMYSNDYIAARVLFFIGIVLLCAKCLTAAETRKSERPLIVSIVIVLLGITLVASSLLWIRHVSNKNHEPTLEVMPTHAWFENSDTEVKADVVAKNVGHGIAHGQIIFLSTICISKPLSSWEVDKLWSSWCDGSVSSAFNMNGHWIEGEEHTVTPTRRMASIPNWRQDWGLIFRQQRYIYVFATLAFDDNEGRMLVESCSNYVWPDLQSHHDCFGHNGPARLTQSFWSRLIQ